MNFASFVRSLLPEPPARVLEVGCGDGALAAELARTGHRVTAIDPRAPEGDIFERVSLEDYTGAGPFDAVVANRSLHHIEDLAAAVGKIAALLDPDGVVVVHEHAWERMDEPTARWFLARHSVDHARGSGAVDEWLSRWRTDHAGLHRYRDLRAELDRHFTERFFEWTPYLHAELADARAEADERARIEDGSIRATGFAFVGRPRRGRGQGA